MTFAEKVRTLLKKSFGGDSDEVTEEQDDEGNSDDIDLEDQDDAGDGGDDGDDGTVTKSNADLLDATDILQALVGELREIKKSIASIVKRQDGVEKSQADLGEAILGVAEIASKIANSPMPRKTTMSKGGLGDNADGGGNSRQLTKADFEVAQIALTKAYQGKRITIQQSARLETEMQKAMQIPGYMMSVEDRALIAREMKSA